MQLDLFMYRCHLRGSAYNGRKKRERQPCGVRETIQSVSDCCGRRIVTLQIAATTADKGQTAHTMLVLPAVSSGRKIQFECFQACPKYVEVCHYGDVDTRRRR